MRDILWLPQNLSIVHKQAACLHKQLSYSIRLNLFTGVLVHTGTYVQQSVYQEFHLGSNWCHWNLGPKNTSYHQVVCFSNLNLTR